MVGYQLCRKVSYAPEKDWSGNKPLCRQTSTVLCGVGEGVAVFVAVGVAVGVLVRVRVGVRVGVFVLVFVAVGVGEEVSVGVGVTGGVSPLMVTLPFSTLSSTELIP